MQFNVTVPLLFITSAICLTVLLYLVKKLRAVSSGIAVLIIVMMIVWALTSAVENMVVSLEGKLFVTHIAYIAYALMPPFWFLFVLTYVTRSPQWKNPFIIGMFAIFAIFILCNWINPGNLFYTATSVVARDGLFYFKADYGPLFWIYTVCSYSVVVIMLVFLLLYRKSGRIKINNVAFILISVLLPILINMLYIFGVMVWDATGLGFSVSSICFLLLYKGEFFAGLPLSHKTVIDEMGTGYILMDGDKRVVEMNAAAKAMLFIGGDNENEAAQQVLLHKWRLDPASADSANTVQQLGGAEGLRYYRVSVNRINAGGKKSDYALLLHDETPLFNAKERMLYLERYDESTELYSRKYFLELIDKEIDKCKSGAVQTVVLVCISVMNYNDCCYFYGNDFGNLMIHGISRAIKDIIRSEDAISRYSLDEIYLFMKFDSFRGLAERVDVTMERIFKRFEAPVEAGGIRFEAKLSIGIAYAPQHADTSNKLINMACMAKRNISRFLKYRYNIYHENTGDSYNRTMRLDRDMHSAIGSGELYLMYQPQVDTLTGRAVGAEALLRWTHPELGLISPVDFIPIAEDNGMIVELGEWVAGEAVAQLKRWHDMGLTDLKVSANVSLNQLTDEHFSEKIINIVDAAGVDATKLELEITESLALFPEAMKHGHLQKLRARGIRIAMDDFGMGHSSLAYIKEFELDTIKIDRALSCDVMTNNTSVAMIRSVSMLCKSLGLTTIVEYIETPDQVECLKSLGCFTVQGYVYAPPLLPKACTTYILNSRKA